MHSHFILWENLHEIGIRKFLNDFKNSLLKPCGHEVLPLRNVWINDRIFFGGGNDSFFLMDKIIQVLNLFQVIFSKEFVFFTLIVKFIGLILLIMYSYL